jgi:integrase
MERYGEVRKLAWRGRISERWYVRVHRDGGRNTWRCTGFRNRAEAEAQVHAWQMDALNGRGRYGAAPPALKALGEWLAVVTLGRSPNYTRCVTAFVRRMTAVLDGRAVDTIQDADFVAWATRRLDAGLAPRTVNLDLTLARMFCSWCVERGWLPRNPVSRRMRVLVPQTRPRVIDDAETARLLDAAAVCGERAVGYVLCMLATGFRSGLVHALRWQHVDLDAGMWRIPAALLKSRREYVHPIAPCMLSWLRLHAAPDDGYVFGPGARAWWYAIRERAGMPTLKRHDLRRTFITRCRRAEIPMEITMALSDHKDVRTMLTVYRRVDECDTRQALARLEAQGGSYA